MSWRWIAGLQLAAGLLLVVAGLVANPVVLAMLAADGRISEPWRVVAAEALLVALGGVLLLGAARTRARRPELRPAQVGAAAALVALSTLLSLAAAEVAVRLVVDPLDYLQGDAWWEYHWRLADRGRGPGTTTEHGYEEYDARLGWRPRPDFRSAEVRTNSLGMRGTREYALEREPGRARVVLVGDSFTWGEEVGDDETFGRLLERLLHPTEVVNLAVRGFGTDQQLLRLRDPGLAFRPDVVVLGLFEENVHRNVLRFRDFAKPRFVLRGGELELVQVPVPEPDAVRAGEPDLPASRLAALLAARGRDLVEKTIFRTPLSQREEVRVTLAILAAAKREAESVGARFVLVFIPWSDFDGAKPLDDVLAAWAAGHGVEYLDLVERFRALPPEERDALYFPGGHWTPFGHAVVASELAELLRTPGASPR